MTIRRVTTIFSVLVISSFFMTACSLVNKNTVDQTGSATNTTVEQQEETQLQQPQSDSTDLDDLDQELTDFTVLEEDFSNL